jgi:hypothetical protein
MLLLINSLLLAVPSFFGLVRSSFPKSLVFSGGILSIGVDPNPFVDNVTVQYTLLAKTHLTMTLTDIYGKNIAVLVDENQVTGAHQETLSVSDLGLSSGVYFFIIQTDSSREVHKIVVSN